MLIIRLSRVGKKKHPSYRLVVQEKKKDPWGKALEYVGFYNPQAKPKTITLKEDRIKFWLARGASTSATVHNLLVNAKVIKGAKVKASHGSDQKKKEGEKKEAKK